VQQHFIGLLERIMEGGFSHHGEERSLGTTIIVSRLVISIMSSTGECAGGIRNRNGSVDDCRTVRRAGFAPKKTPPPPHPPPHLSKLQMIGRRLCR